MIYKDIHSKYDLAHRPYDRQDCCLNCGWEHRYHIGWACHNHYDFISRTDYFSMSRQNYQYLTQSMKDSLNRNIPDYPLIVNLHTSDKCMNPFIAAKPTIDQWQAWAHNQPGDCACGIKKDSCDYHKSS